MKRLPARLLPLLDLLLLAGLITLHLWLHAQWDTPLGIDIQPAPDAVEHVGVAESILAHGVPAIEFSDGSLYPSRYEIGFPAVLALWYAITGGDQTSVLTLNLWLGVAIVVLTYLLAKLIGGRFVAVIASMLTILCPRLLSLIEVAMSEPLTMVLFLLASVLALRRAKRGGRLSAVLVGFTCGAMCSVRLTHVFHLVHLLPMAMLVRRHHRARDFFWGCVGFAPWVILLALLHWWLNGSPSVQGYELWAPYALIIGDGWHWEYFFAADPGGQLVERGGIFAPHWRTLLPMLLGFPAKHVPPLLFYPWPLMVGAVLFFMRGRRPIRHRWAWTLLACVLFQLIIWGFYYYWAPRFFLPLIPPLIILGCAGLAPRWRRGFTWGNATRVALLALALWQQAFALHWFYQHSVGMDQSERLSLEEIDEIVPLDAAMVVDMHHIVARDVFLHDQRVMTNWAIDGVDQLLHEQQVYQVAPLREGDGSPLALYQGRELLPGGEAFIASAEAEARSLWVVIPKRHYPLRAHWFRMHGIGLPAEPNGPQNGNFHVWVWPETLAAQFASPEPTITPNPVSPEGSDSPGAFE